MRPVNAKELSDHILSLTLSKGEREVSPVKCPRRFSGLKKVWRGLEKLAIREFLCLPGMGLP